MVSSAENFVGHLVLNSSCDIANNDLFALCNHYAVDRSCIVRCSLATPAEGFDLKSLNAIGKFNKTRRPWKEFGPKISKNSEGIDIYTESIGNSRELFYL
jgi:hypothetical protein